MNKRKSILIGVLLLLFSGAVLADNALKQKVTWSPETLNLPSLKPGESTTTSVILTNTSVLANQKLEGEHLAFQVTNGAGTLITATANFPKKIAPGQKVTVTLVVSVASSTPALPPRVIAGKVQLVRKEDGDGDDNKKKDKEKDEVKNFGKLLSVNIAVSSIALPSFPNKKEDEATIAGLDSNANSVPDRAEWFIVATAPDSEKKRGAMMLSAKSQQFFLLDYLAHKNDDPATLEVRVKGNNVAREKSINCEEYVFGVSSFYLFKVAGGREAWDAYTGVTQDLEALFYNTPERLRNFKDAERPLVATGDRGILPEQYKQECLDFGFDPDSLLN